MKNLKLHFKTTLLVSAITLAVLGALLFVLSARMVDQIRADEKAITELAAVNLAHHFSELPKETSAAELAQAAALIYRSRLDDVAVIYWENEGDFFSVKLTAGSSAATQQQMPAQAAAALRQQQIFRLESGKIIETANSLYRVFAPVVQHGKVIGAVEISDHLNNLPLVLKRTVNAAIWLALLAVGLIAIATFIMFRDLIYQPLSALLQTIEHAGAGELAIKAPVHRNDELGLLAKAFNRMLQQLYDMTAEREQQGDILRERVQAATAELAQRNAELATANMELWSTSRKLTQMERLAAAGQTAAQFAHEVGTPLNLISCHAQLIQAEKNAPETSLQERADIIVEQTERIEKIVRAMLDRTRHIPPELHPLDVREVIKKIAVAMSPTINNRKAQLALNLAPQLPLIAADAESLQQVFINLINNALDAMPAGGVLTISTTFLPLTDKDAARVQIEFRDNGCGMTPEIKAHIFDPLYTTKERGKGTGLGLVVVDQVLREHQATIQVESAPRAGAVFQLEFPVAIPINADNAKAEVA